MSWTANESAYWAIAAVPINPAPSFDLTVAVEGAGTTVPSKGVHTYAPGTVVEVTATPAAGYVLDHWSGVHGLRRVLHHHGRAQDGDRGDFAVSVDVSIERFDVDDVRLTWPHLAAAVDYYSVYRSLIDPYFSAGEASKLPGDVSPSDPAYTDTDAI